MTTTRLWRPLEGVAQGAVAALLETVRQNTWSDQDYIEENYYGFTLRGPSNIDGSMGLQPGGAATFIFPVGPQSVRSSTQYRQAVTPTLGGLVTEERGIAWRDITIEGNFGLQAKYGYDTTVNTAILKDRKAVPWGTPVSGPLWTRKMLANFFDRYAQMKGRPDENQLTTLVFHNFKDDEHWIVVPTKVDLNRSTATRMMYPFSIQLRAVARTSAVVVAPAPASIASTLAQIQNGVRAARQAAEVLTSGIDTLTAALGKIRYAIATVDSLIDEMGRVLAACNSLVNEGKRLADLDGMFMASVTATMEQALDLHQVKDRDAGFPEDARQAMLGAVDAYDICGAQAEFQVTTTAAEKRAGLEANQSAGAGSRDSGSVTTAGTVSALSASGGGATPRTLSQSDGWVPYTIESGDTLPSIALSELGDSTRWFEIAMRNSLRAPYVTASGVPGTATIGDSILIPALIPNKKTTAASDAESPTPEALYGTDLRVYETPRSRAGRPEVDLRIDARTGKDVAVISGVANLVQACQMRLWTTQGTLLMHRGYGLPATIGHPNTTANALAVRQAVKSGLKGDSRIRRIQNMIVVREDDTVNIEAEVIPVGSSEGLTVGVAVV